MVVATFKDLCVDAREPARLGRFWGEVLGLELETFDDGDARLHGAAPQQTVWVNRVPEPVTVKQRVHLDVHAASTQAVLDLGAGLEESFERWDLVRDPEGGELCVFTRDEVPAYRLYELVVDAADPVVIAQWWADVLGATARHGGGDDGYSWLEDVPGLPFEAWIFQPVPEPKTVKNRIHWDVVTPDPQLLVEMGARVLRDPDSELDWTVLADPEGNEFCAFLPGDA